jgi:AcrR family transcriptional regulator
VARRTDPIGDSIWLRPPRGQGGQPALNRDQIVRATMELLDADGLPGLSMRRLGAKLGSGATSIYWYVANKDELLDLALDAAMGEVPVPDPAQVGWRAAAEAVARETRAMILRHPWIVGVFGVRPNIGPSSMRLGEDFIGVLEAAGFTGLAIAHASSALMAHAIGSAVTEAAWRTTVARSGMTEAEMEKVIESHAEEFMAGHPHYEKWWHANQMRDMRKLQEDSFTFGLERILDGLSAWLARG